jgi:hypothetical protein
LIQAKNSCIVSKQGQDEIKKQLQVVGHTIISDAVTALEIKADPTYEYMQTLNSLGHSLETNSELSSQRSRKTIV